MVVGHLESGITKGAVEKGATIGVSMIEGQIAPKAGTRTEKITATEAASTTSTTKGIINKEAESMA